MKSASEYVTKEHKSESMSNLDPYSVLSFDRQRQNIANAVI